MVTRASPGLGPEDTRTRGFRALLLLHPLLTMPILSLTDGWWPALVTEVLMQILDLLNFSYTQHFYCRKAARYSYSGFPSYTPGRVTGVMRPLIPPPHYWCSLQPFLFTTFRSVFALDTNQPAQQTHKYSQAPSSVFEVGSVSVQNPIPPLIASSPLL